MRSLSRLTIMVAVGVLALTGVANAGYVYLRSTVGAPWGLSDSTDAMNAVFGVGNWSDLRYETASVESVFSSSNSFVYLDGSADNAIEMATFLNTNRATIESWVIAGGRLLINAAPNEGGDVDLGFGFLLCYGGNPVDLCESSFTENSLTADANDSAHPIFQGPATPVGSSFTGNPFSRGTVIGGFGEGILTTAAFNSNLIERDFGSGHVVVGTMTLPAFQEPGPNAMNLYRNTIAYAAAHGGLLLTTERASNNNLRAAALLRQTATVDLTTLANTLPETLAGYQAIWVNPFLTSADYAALRTAVAPGGGLEQYANNGGTLVLNVAGNSGSQNDIAPGGIDYDRDFYHDAESFALPTHPYLTGANHNGVPLSPSDFDSWFWTDHGFLTNLLPGATVLSNVHGPSFVEYAYGAGRVILTTLTYGWSSAGAQGPARDNLLFYAAGPRIVTGIPNITRLAVALFTLRSPGDPGDTLPLGPSIFYWVGFFDTGSTRVTLEDAAAIQLDFFNPSLPIFLDVRLWGLGAMNKLTLGAPLDYPQTETPAIDVLEAPSGSPSLFGGPVTNEVLAEIDYARTVERDFLGGVIKSPAITYYEPGDPAIPTPLFWVDLNPSGNVNPGVTGYRYLFGGMRFINGAAIATDTTWDFLYDTGNTSTQITTGLATALGINLAAPPDDVVCLGASLPDCVGGDLLDGYTIDRVEIDGIGGTYQYAIDQPIVFVQPSGLGGADANVGANFFDGNRVLFDGPDDRLGLDAVGPVPEPGLLLQLTSGILGLVMLEKRRRSANR